MPRKQIVDEVANNGIRLVSELGYDATDQDAGAAVPFEIDHAVRFRALWIFAQP